MVVKYTNRCYILPAITLFGERGYYMYIEVSWLYRGIAFKLYENE